MVSAALFCSLISMADEDHPRRRPAPCPFQLGAWEHDEGYNHSTGMIVSTDLNSGSPVKIVAPCSSAATTANASA